MKQILFQDLREAGEFAMREHSARKVTMQYDYTNLSSQQIEVYEKLMRGLSLYTPQELWAMNSNKKKKIQAAHIKAKQILTVWKQELIVEKSNNILLSLFPNSSLVKEIVNEKEIRTRDRIDLTFRQLNIKRSQILTKLGEHNLLPRNFAVL